VTPFASKLALKATADVPSITNSAALLAAPETAPVTYLT